MQKLRRTVVHFGKHDPSTHVGGVEAFAKNLGLVFDEVLFFTKKSADFARVRRERLAVVCDNQHVREVPSDIPVIGFQHGVAAEKRLVTGTFKDRLMAYGQRRAAARPNVLWVACAQWISRRFAELHGNGARHVIYHMVDLERFDARLDNQGSRLLLHDARSPAKGSVLVERLARALPEWRLEPLACAPAEVPGRMRRARAFVHLSRYEGNSIVCNEAMAMNLPCLFTRVGLMRDEDGPKDVSVIEPALAFGDETALIAHARAFVDSLHTRPYSPRAWVQAHASPELTKQRWARAVEELEGMWGG